MNQLLYKDEISAVDAKFEAQKIAFGPFVFQAARIMKDIGMLNLIYDAGDAGLTKAAIMDKIEIDSYTFNVLVEMGLSSNILKLVKESDPLHYRLSKTGFFLIHDKMTEANMDFMHHVCYQANFYLDESLKTQSPAGLKVFGDWPTVYEGLSSLPDDAKDSWFKFDHYYSDCAFPSALKHILKNKYKHLMDIGGNTAKWALACMDFDPDIKVTIVDLPGQAEVALQKIKEAGHSERISIYESNVLNHETVLPSGCDAVWMSQFLDCFSLEEISGILTKVHQAVDEKCDVYVMEPLWDKQRFPAARFSLHATSLYFSSVANGNSKMYGFDELVDAIQRAGFELADSDHRIGPNDYSILKFNKSGTPCPS